MLIGEFITPVGDKNRVAIPKKLRDQLEGDIVITKGYEGCLILVDKSRWIQLISQINKYPLLGMNVRDTKRFLLGGAFDLDIDKQGRFVIPEALVLYGQLAEEVVFVGVGEWIEVWSNLNWQAKSDYLAKYSADIADRLGQS